MVYDLPSLYEKNYPLILDMFSFTSKKGMLYRL